MSFCLFIGADNLHLEAGSQTSKQELAKLGFNDWVSLKYAF